MKITKKMVIAVLRGESGFTKIEYKGVKFKYCANNMTYRDCHEYINERLNERY